MARETKKIRKIEVLTGFVRCNILILFEGEPHKHHGFGSVATIERAFDSSFLAYRPAPSPQLHSGAFRER